MKGGSGEDSLGEAQRRTDGRVRRLHERSELIRVNAREPEAAEVRLAARGDVLDYSCETIIRARRLRAEAGEPSVDCGNDRSIAATREDETNEALCVQARRIGRADDTREGGLALRRNTVGAKAWAQTSRAA